MRRSALARSALAAVILLLHGSPALAVVISVSETVANFGTLNQLAATGACANTNIACGPVATVNSFIYLQNTYPQIYDTTLVPAGKEKDVAATLADLMSCGALNCPGGSLTGTTATGLTGGKALYLAGVTTGVNLLSRTNIVSQSFVPKTNNTFVGEIPTLSFLLRQLPPPRPAPQVGEDVEMLVGFYTQNGANFTRTGGHWVTATGASYNDNNGNITPATISFVDPLGMNANAPALPTNGDTLTTINTPWGSLLQISNYFANASPLWNTATFGNRTDNNTKVLIDAIAAESPVLVYEPGTIALLLSGLAAFGALWRRRRAPQ